MNYTPFTGSTAIMLTKLSFKSLLYRLLLCLGLFSSVQGFGQTNSVSPLSINGIGETYFGVTPNFLAMGGSGLASVDPFSINVFNPAGYTNMEFATLEMSGAQRSFRHRVEDQDLDQYNFNTYFDFFGFGFRFNEFFAGSFSMTPFAAKGYNISVNDTSDDFGFYQYRSVGSGGYDKFTFGFACEPVSWFSVGANAKYFFGEIEESNNTIIADPAFLSVANTVRTGVSDFLFDLGTQFKFEVKDYGINLGAIYALGTDLDARQITSQYTFVNGGIVQTPVDTLIYDLSTEGTMVLPSSYGIGFGFNKSMPNSSMNAWDLLFDYKVTNWQDFRAFIPENGASPQGSMLSSTRISFGGAIVPALCFKNASRSRNYLTMIRYRFGGFQEVGQFRWDDDGYTSRELSFGLSLPVVYRSLAPGEQKASFLNISIGNGQRWDGNSTSLRENYWNFNLGMTLNDKWFQKFKYR